MSIRLSPLGASHEYTLEHAQWNQLLCKPYAFAVRDCPQ